MYTHLLAESPHSHNVRNHPSIYASLAEYHENSLISIRRSQRRHSTQTSNSDERFVLQVFKRSTTPVLRESLHEFVASPSHTKESISRVLQLTNEETRMKDNEEKRNSRRLSYPRFKRPRCLVHKKAMIDDLRITKMKQTLVNIHDGC